MFLGLAHQHELGPAGDRGGGTAIEIEYRAPEDELPACQHWPKTMILSMSLLRPVAVALTHNSDPL
jgi:hypothetical protein